MTFRKVFLGPFSLRARSFTLRSHCCPMSITPDRTSDRMHDMIQTEPRLFILWLLQNSVTPVFRTKSMLLLKLTCIFLKAPSRKQSFFYFHMTRARKEPHSAYIMPMQCTVHGAIIWHHFGFAKCFTSWDILEKHTYKQTYIHTYKHEPSPFHIACWTPASRLRRSAPVWTSYRMHGIIQTEARLFILW